MIQRIQSVYLLLTTILAVLFLAGEIINFENGNTLLLTGIGGEAQSTGINKFLPLTILLVIVPVLSFIIIFIYKKRILQLKLTTLLIVFIVLLIAALIYYSVDIVQSLNTQPEPGYKLFLPVLMLIFAFLAYRGIRKDENIVRSYDRLR